MGNSIVLTFLTALYGEISQIQQGSQKGIIYCFVNHNYIDRNDKEMEAAGMIKKSKKYFYLIGLFLVLFVFRHNTYVYAQDKIHDPYENLENLVDVTITLVIPDGENFDERVEVYIDKEEYAMFKNEAYPNMGYQLTIPIEEGIHDMVVLSSTDVVDKYEFIYDSKLDTNQTTNITITTKHSFDTQNNSNDYSTDAGDVYADVDIEPVTPAYYDFSEGYPSGTFHISCASYPAFKDVTFTLVGGPENKMYEIKLARENLFKADVVLPAGSYYESSNFDFTYSEGVSNDDFIFLWRHSDNLGTYGDYYDITEGGETTLSDLVIYMNYGSEIAEVNTNILVEKDVREKQEQIKEEHFQKELQEAFPEDYTTEEETIAEAQPVEPSADYGDIIKIAIITISVLAVLGIAVAIIRKRKS